MQVCGLMVVRNEADIIRANILYHLSAGIDRFLIVDNGSSDGTDEILRELGKDPRVSWRRDAGPFRQAEMATELAREAHREGADWLLSVDADEFWYAPRRDFRQVLEDSQAGGLQVHLVNFVQRRDQLRPSPGALLHMTRRPAVPIGPLEHIRHLVSTKCIAFVEAMFPPKWISRACAALQIAKGNHLVTGTCGPLHETDRIVCLHAPLRARAILESKKITHGRRVEEVGISGDNSWHLRRWRQLADNGELTREWLANSYEDNCLDVYGAAHTTVYDPRLRDAVAPFVGVQQPLGPDAQLLAARHDINELLFTVHEELASHLKLLTAVGERDRIIRNVQEQLSAKQAEVGERDTIINSLQADLRTIRQSRAWRVLSVYWALRRKMGKG